MHVISENAKMVMRRMLDMCIHLHRNNVGFRHIESDHVVVRSSEPDLPCFNCGAFIGLPANDEFRRLEMMRASFTHVRDFLKDQFFKLGPSGLSPSYELNDFLGLLEVPSTVSSQRELDLWSSHLKDHVALKTESEWVEYLKTILDRSRELHPPIDGQWDTVLDRMSDLRTFDNWVQKIESKPRSILNVTLVTEKIKPYEGNEIADLIRCLRDLLRDLHDKLHLGFWPENVSVYRIITDVFPELIPTLQSEIYGAAPELRAYLLS